MAAVFKQPYIFRCHTGLIGWAIPIYDAENHIYTIVCSQVLMWKPGTAFWDDLRRLSMDLGLDIELIKAKAQELEVLSPDKIQAAAELLFIIANYLAKSGAAFLKKDLSPVEFNIKEVLNQKKNSTRKEVLEKEEELFGALPVGNVSELVGYNNHSYFAKVFKKNCGMTPAKYKEIYS